MLIKWVEWHPWPSPSVRSAIAAATLWAVLRRPRFDWSAAQIGGAVAYAATVLLYVSAVKLTTAANAILLQYTAPIYVALFGAWFLGERTTWLDWLAIACSLGGMALFFRDGPFSIHSLDADGGAQAPPACCMLWYLASGGGYAIVGRCLADGSFAQACQGAASPEALFAQLSASGVAASEHRAVSSGLGTVAASQKRCRSGWYGVSSERRSHVCRFDSVRNARLSPMSVGHPSPADAARVFPSPVRTSFAPTIHSQAPRCRSHAWHLTSHLRSIKEASHERALARTIRDLTQGREPRPRWT